MKKILLLMITAAFLIGCNEKDLTPKVDFGYRQTGALTIEFVNLSDNIVSYEWDFGDGEKAYTANPSHTYAKVGIYTVTLIGDGIYEHTIKIEVEKLKPYVVGWKLYAIPYQNKYYKLIMYDDKKTSSSSFVTRYSKSLSNKDLPFTHTFSEGRQMDELSGSNYYHVDLYYSSDTSTDGTKCFSGVLKIQDMEKYRDEYVWNYVDDKGVKVSVLFEYRR